MCIRDRTFCSTGFCSFSFMIYGMGPFLAWNMQPPCTYLGLFISSANNSKNLEYAQKFWKHEVQTLEKTAVSFSRTVPLRLNKSTRTKCWKPSLFQGLKTFMKDRIGPLTAHLQTLQNSSAHLIVLGFLPVFCKYTFFRVSRLLPITCAPLKTNVLIFSHKMKS